MIKNYFTISKSTHCVIVDCLALVPLSVITT